MKQGMTIVQLAEELQRIAAVKRDFLAPSGQISVEVAENNLPAIRLAANDERFTIGDTAHSQIAEKTGVPKRYYDRMLREEPRLFAETLNTWLRHNGDSSKVNLVRTLDGNVRGFLSDRYRCLDSDIIAEALLPVMVQMGATMESCNVSEKYFHLKAIIHSEEYVIPVVGHVIKAGIEIKTSDVGLSGVNVLPFMMVTRCTNGMAINEAAIRKAHIGKADSIDDVAAQYYRSETRQLEDRAFLAKLVDAVTGIFSKVNFQLYVNKLGEAYGDKIADETVVKVVEVVSDRFAFTKDENQSVLRHLLAGGDLSRYGLIQAVTRAAQDLPSYDRASEFEELGGTILELPKSDWTSITRSALLQ